MVTVGGAAIAATCRHGAVGRLPAVVVAAGAVAARPVPMRRLDAGVSRVAFAVLAVVELAVVDVRLTRLQLVVQRYHPAATATGGGRAGGY